MEKEDCMDSKYRRLDRDAVFLMGFTSGSYVKKPLPLTRKAVAFAAQCHKNETRDGGDPYISHPLAACNMLIILGVTKDEYLAAVILHDVVENGHATLKEIKKEFGKKVARLVDNQTKRKNESSDEYFTRVGSDIGSILGKGVDRLSNISSMIGVYDLERLKEYVEETEGYVMKMLYEVRYLNLKYANALVLLYDQIKNIIRATKSYIDAEERALAAQSQTLNTVTEVNRERKA